MKHIFIILIISVIASFSIYGAEKGAGITFEEKSHDFGTIKEVDGPVSYSFKFENTGDEPLVIINVNASCGCTRPDYPKEPIRPGKKGEIKITYNPAGRPGEFTKDVKIRTNGSKRPILKISGVVIPKNSVEK